MALITPQDLNITNLMKNPELQTQYRYIITNGKLMVLTNFGAYSFVRDAEAGDYGLYPQVDTTTE